MKWRIFFAVLMRRFYVTFPVSAVFVGRGERSDNFGIGEIFFSC